MCLIIRRLSARNFAGGGPRHWAEHRQTYRSSRNPNWMPGEKQPIPKELGQHKSFDPIALSSSYSLLISAIVPRPIAFVSTCGGPGGDNLAPFSYFNVMAHDPPTIAIGISKAGKGATALDKDTYANIKTNGEFTVNMISEWFVEAANHTCGEYPPQASEWLESGLTPLPSSKVKPPRVAESGIHMECILRHDIPVVNNKGDTTSNIILGEVVMFHVAEGLLKPDSKALEIDSTRLRPVSRLGGSTFGLIGETFDYPRPYAKRR